MSQRFTEAELAAEYWQAMAHSQVMINMANNPKTTHTEYVDKIMRANEDTTKAAVLFRLATQPHAHEEPKAHRFSCNQCPATLETDDAVQGGYWISNHYRINHTTETP